MPPPMPPAGAAIAAPAGFAGSSGGDCCIPRRASSTRSSRSSRSSRRPSSAAHHSLLPRHLPHHSLLGLRVGHTVQQELSLLKLFLGVLRAGRLVLIIRGQLPGCFMEFLHAVAVGCPGRERVRRRWSRGPRLPRDIRLDHVLMRSISSTVKLRSRESIRSNVRFVAVDLRKEIGRNGFIRRTLGCCWLAAGGCASEPRQLLPACLRRPPECRLCGLSPGRAVWHRRRIRLRACHRRRSSRR